MIEFRAGAVILEAIRVVAVIAGALKPDFLESPVVGIVVTALAAAEIQPFELSGLLTGPRSVALLASNGLMLSGEREVRAGVIESGSRLEGVLVVAAEAIGAELALMLILMTGKALTAKTKKRPVEIFQFDLGPNGGGNPGRDMTLLAFLLSMLAGQGEARLGEVVELLTVQGDERGFSPVMFFMTAPAIRFASRAFVRPSMKPRMSIHPAPDLGVTFQTLETARAYAKLMTGPALGDTIQLLVSA